MLLYSEKKNFYCLQFTLKILLLQGNNKPFEKKTAVSLKKLHLKLIMTSIVRVLLNEKTECLNENYSEGRKEIEKGTE